MVSRTPPPPPPPATSSRLGSGYVPSFAGVRMSLAPPPPPPPPANDPHPPPPNVPHPVPPAWPTFTCRGVPGVTVSVAVTSAPTPPAARNSPDPSPSAPYRVKVAEVTPAGTVHVDAAGLGERAGDLVAAGRAAARGGTRGPGRDHRDQARRAQGCGQGQPGRARHRAQQPGRRGGHNTRQARPVHRMPFPYYGDTRAVGVVAGKHRGRRASPSLQRADGRRELAGSLYPAITVPPG